MRKLISKCSFKNTFKLVSRMNEQWHFGHLLIIKQKCQCKICLGSRTAQVLSCLLVTHHNYVVRPNCRRTTHTLVMDHTEINLKLIDKLSTWLANFHSAISRLQAARGEQVFKVLPSPRFWVLQYWPRQDVFTGTTRHKSYRVINHILFGFETSSIGGFFIAGTINLAKCPWLKRSYALWQKLLLLLY